MAALAALTAVWLATAATCSSEEPAQRDAGAGPSVAGSGAAGPGTGGSSFTVIISSRDAGSTPPPTPPSDVVFPDPPLISCDDSAPNGGGCDFINSVCSVPACDDAGACGQSHWMKAYGNPRCVGGQCVWDPMYYDCADLCVNGGCFYNGTTIP